MKAPNVRFDGHTYTITFDHEWLQANDMVFTADPAKAYWINQKLEQFNQKVTKKNIDTIRRPNQPVHPSHMQSKLHHLIWEDIRGPR